MAEEAVEAEGGADAVPAIHADNGPDRVGAEVRPARTRTAFTPRRWTTVTERRCLTAGTGTSQGGSVQDLAVLILRLSPNPCRCGKMPIRASLPL